jgi:hypothetical protein
LSADDDDDDDDDIQPFKFQAIVHCIMLLHITVYLNKRFQKDCGFVNAVKALPMFLVINFRTADLFDTVGPWAKCTVKAEFQ